MSLKTRNLAYLLFNMSITPQSKKVISKDIKCENCNKSLDYTGQMLCDTCFTLKFKKV